MQRFCFVHAADLHLDTPFEGIRSAAPRVNQALRDASLDAWDDLVELCIERDAAFLLVAGDVYDGAERGLRAQLRFRSGLERLGRHGIQAFVVHGNHDPTREGWSAIREWPDGACVFGSDPGRAREGVPVEREGVRLATVYGVSYPERDVTDNLALAFPRAGGPRASGERGEGLRIGLLHCNVRSGAGAAEHAAYSPCTLDDLAAADIDYWALGHVHRHEILARGNRVGEPWVVYPGNLQGRSPRASERGPKGAVVVEVECDSLGARVARAELCAVDRIRFLEVPFDVAECRDLAEVQRALESRAEVLRAEHAGRGLLLSARLYGRSDLYLDLARAESASELLAALRDASREPGEPRENEETVERDGFTWWSSVTTDVGRPFDRAALRERDDLGAELIALADELREQPEELARLADALFEELPPEIRGVAAPALEPGDLIALLHRAEETALEAADLGDPPVAIGREP